MGFEEPQLRVMFCCGETGFRRISYISAYTVHQSGLVLWYCLVLPGKAGNYLVAGIRIAVVILGRHILDGKPGIFQRKATSLEPFSLLRDRNWNKAAPLLSICH